MVGAVRMGRASLSGVKLVIKNFLVQGMNTAITLAFTIIGARLLSVADYGELRYVMTLLPLFMALSMPGYDRIILRNTNLRQPVPLMRIFRIRIAAGLAGSLLILAGTFIFQARLSGTLTFFLLVTAVLLPLYETATGYKNFLIGRGLRNRSLDLILQSRLLCLALLAVFLAGIYLAQAGMVWLYPAYLLANIVSTLYPFGRVALRRSGRQVRARHRRGSVAVVHAASSTAAGIIYTLAFSLDKLWVRHELGAEALAMYGLLIMVPLELARLLESTIPLFYRRLFFSRQPSEIGRAKLLLLLAPFVVAGYAVTFYALSGFIFGAAYTYPFFSVLLSSLMIVSLSAEYLYNHKIFALLGANAMFAYSALNLAVSAAVILAGLHFGGIDGLIAALIIKQAALPPAFIALRRKMVP